MKANKKPMWVPKWFKSMPEKHKKIGGTWVAWLRPAPSKDPKLTNKQRFEANPKNQRKQNVQANSN